MKRWKCNGKGIYHKCISNDIWRLWFSMNEKLWNKECYYGFICDCLDKRIPGKIKREAKKLIFIDKLLRL